MTTRREALGLLGSISIGSLLAAPGVGPVALLAREWAYAEPALVRWMFSRHRPA